MLRVKCVGWLALYFAFLFLQSATKFYAYAQLRRASKQSDEKAPSFGEVKYGSLGGAMARAGGGPRGLPSEAFSRGVNVISTPPCIIHSWLSILQNKQPGRRRRAVG